MNKHSKKSPMQINAQVEREYGRRRKAIALPPELRFTPKEGYRMIAKVPEDIFEETGSPTIKNYATKFKHVSALLLDKGVYEVSLHPNRYTVILKEAATGEPVYLSTPLTRLEFQRRVHSGEIIYSEVIIPKKKAGGENKASE